MRVSIIFTIILVLATSTFAASNIKIYGDLEFSDGTKQNSATVQGPVGLQGAKGDTGAQGPVGQITLTAICDAINAGGMALPTFCPIPNIAPVANAGISQNVVSGTLVTLNGSASSDSNGDLLTYSWFFSSKPNGSSATLSSTTAVNPTFTADLAGVYVLNLIVNDGKVNSTLASVNVTASGGYFSSLVGTYDGDSYGGSNPKDSTSITVGVTGSTLKITDAAFFGGTCIYSATITVAGNAISSGTYQCADFTAGSWTLSQMKVVDTSDIYVSIRKDGNATSRMYGAK